MQRNYTGHDYHIYILGEPNLAATPDAIKTVLAAAAATQDCRIVGQHKRSVHITWRLTQPQSWPNVRAQLQHVLTQHPLSMQHEWIVLPPRSIQQPRLLVMDMDSTLIGIEVIDVLAAHYGVGEQVAAITESAMFGEIDFSESLRQRMRLLRGLPKTLLQQVANNMPLNPGAETLIKTAQQHGCKTAVVTGGFDYFATVLQQRLGLDFAVANRFYLEHDCLTGEVAEPIVDAEGKANALRRLSQQLSINSEQTVAIGDGANDLRMFAAAGLGIAYHSKPIVQQQADVVIHKLGLDAIADLLFK